MTTTTKKIMDGSKTNHNNSIDLALAFQSSYSSRQLCLQTCSHPVRTWDSMLRHRFRKNLKPKLARLFLPKQCTTLTASTSHAQMKNSVDFPLSNVTTPWYARPFFLPQHSVVHPLTRMYVEEIVVHELTQRQKISTIKHHQTWYKGSWRQAQLHPHQNLSIESYSSVGPKRHQATLSSSLQYHLHGLAVAYMEPASSKVPWSQRSS